MVVIFGKEREHEETEHAGSRGTGKEEAQTQGHRSKNRPYGDAYIPSNTALHALVGGGNWNNGVRDGSRAVNAYYCPWSVHGYIGVWCVCDAQ